MPNYYGTNIPKQQQEPQMSRLSGKTIFISGGTTGIGLATAKLFKSEGARVAVSGRNPDTLAAARKELGPDAIVIASDAAKLSDITTLVDKLKASFDKLDYVFVNAGIAKFLPFTDVTEELFDETINTNLKGAYFLIQKLLPLLPNGSAIVLNTSVADSKGLPTTSFYGASKAGLRALARTLAPELLPRGIRINAVSPGPITTPIYAKLGQSPEVQQVFAAQMTEANPMKRFGTPEEVAKAVLYLAQDATYSTGSELAVDGGFAQL
jgi:NAD(P)-dependent dehydrogenase (short-subunit alcohol dehydrogenase family)